MCHERYTGHQQNTIRYNWVNVSHIQSTEIHRKGLMDIINNLKQDSISRVISPSAAERLTDRPHRLRRLSMCPYPPNTNHLNTHQLWKTVQSRHVFVDKLEEVGRTPHIIPPDLILTRLKTVRQKLLDVPQNDTSQLQQVDWWGQHIPKKRSSGPHMIHISTHISETEPNPPGMAINAIKYRYRSPETCNSRQMSRDKSPERSLSRDKSPERSLSRDKSPERSLSRDKSPERNEFPVHGVNNDIRLLVSNTDSVQLPQMLKPVAKKLPTIRRAQTFPVKKSNTVQLEKRFSLDTRMVPIIDKTARSFLERMATSRPALMI
jgi:hypothetical protein